MLPQNFNPHSIPGVQAVAPAYYQPDAGVSGSDTSVSGATLMAVDTSSYLKVTRGTPAAVTFPQAMSHLPSGNNLGTKANPLPAIVSADWPDGMKVGQLMQVTLESVSYWIQVSGTAADFPSMPTDGPFIILDMSWLQAANPDVGRTVPISRLYIRGGGNGVTAQLQRLIQQEAAGAVLTTRADALSSNSHQLLSNGVTNAFRYSVVLVTLFAAASGSVALMLASAERRRDLSYLRTLGLSARQALGITIVEQVPPLLSAAVAGAALGIAIARLVGPALNLSAFAGRPGVAAGILINWWQIVALTSGISLVVLVAIVGFGFLSRHLDLAGALRLGDR